MGQERAPSTDLKKLGEEVHEWREREGGRGSKIPEALWAEAVRVAGIDGIWRTAQVTRFKHGALKDRVARAGGSVGAAASGGRRRRRRTRRARPKPMKRANAFVEVNAAQLLGAAAPGAVVEVEDKSGVRLVVRLANEAYVDMGEIISAFRRRRG
jgi:hypothetical protein